MIRRLCLSLALLLLVAACAEPEILAPRSAAVPVGTDLTGNWRLRDPSPADRRRLREAIEKTDGIRNSGRGPRQAQRNTRGGIVYVFLETGSALKVTQTDHALFISFDRSVVEEFRFGERRLVSIGEVEAQRVTGWENDELVVETLDGKGMKMTERFALIDGGDTLRRQITLRSRNLEEESIVQLFDRRG